MSKFYILLFLIILLGIGYLASINKETITVALTPKDIYETPKIVLILFSGFAGALIVFVLFMIRDTRRFIKNISFQKRQKLEEKARELYSKGLDLLLAKRYDDAKETFEATLREYPDYIDAYLKLTDIALMRGDLQKAYSYVEKARNLAPKRIDVLFATVNIMERAGRFNDALKQVDNILEIDETNLTALYRKRQILENLSQWEDLIDLQREIIKNLKDEKLRDIEKEYLAGYKYEYGRWCLERKEYERAKKSFKTALRIKRDFIPAYIGYAEALISEELIDDTVNFLTESFETTGSAILLARLEDLLISQGEPGRLLRIYRTAVSRRQDNTLLTFLLGKLYYRLEMIDDAIDTFRTIESQGVSFPELHRLLGNIYLKRKQIEKAAIEFRKATERKTMRLNYCCSTCGFTSETWSGRCPGCKLWNTFTFNLEWICKSPSKEGESSLIRATGSQV